MPRFSYIAIDHNRKTAKGTVTAESSYSARKHLRSRGLHPTTIKELTHERRSWSLASVLSKSGKNSRMTVCHLQFSRYLRVLMIDQKILNQKDGLIFSQPKWGDFMNPGYQEISLH